MVTDCKPLNTTLYTPFPLARILVLATSSQPTLLGASFALANVVFPLLPSLPSLPSLRSITPYPRQAHGEPSTRVYPLLVSSPAAPKYLSFALIVDNRSKAFIVWPIVGFVWRVMPRRSSKEARVERSRDVERDWLLKDDDDDGDDENKRKRRE